MGKFCNSLAIVCLCFLSFNEIAGRVARRNEVSEDEQFTKSLPKKVRLCMMDMFAKLDQERPVENILISPISVYASLMIMHLGAEGHTRNRLDEVLKITGENVDYEKLHKTFGQILENIEREVTKPDDPNPQTVKLTNGFFVQKDDPIRESYIRLLRKYDDANANVTNVDFRRHAIPTTNSINAWISERTNKRIETFYETPLPSNTWAVSPSAFYIDGVWQHPFNKERTEEGTFNIGTTQIEVPMMRNQRVISYSYSDVLQFESIELPFEGGDIVMTIALPRGSQTLRNITEHDHLLDMNELRRNTKTVAVDYKIPKMQLSWKHSLVNALGLEDVFRSADLGGMTANKLVISDMLHATDIEVDEQGISVPTSATLTNMKHVRESSAATPTAEIQFFVDRPYFVNILHKPTGMMLLTGAVYKPQ